MKLASSLTNECTSLDFEKRAFCSYNTAAARYKYRSIHRHLYQLTHRFANGTSSESESLSESESESALVAVFWTFPGFSEPAARTAAISALVRRLRFSVPGVPATGAGRSPAAARDPASG